MPHLRELHCQLPLLSAFSPHFINACDPLWGKDRQQEQSSWAQFIHIRMQVSSPCVFVWTNSFPFPLRVPAYGQACGVVCRLPQDVNFLSPPLLLDFCSRWFLACVVPPVFITYYFSTKSEYLPWTAVDKDFYLLGDGSCSPPCLGSMENYFLGVTVKNSYLGVSKLEECSSCLTNSSSASVPLWRSTTKGVG
ncbi:hypothetical protein ElyMa_005250100 [Elysia marginata]|uniref:Uncharacterized protein n=1 Tax=Elysia marginata TaxID=1093978 RepID=A0AAV4K308_9GAST|nr:hypothetical protein ElyMa_005250100 [Elysia marginata]